MNRVFTIISSIVVYYEQEQHHVVRNMLNGESAHAVVSGHVFAPPRLGLQHRWGLLCNALWTVQCHDIVRGT